MGKRWLGRVTVVRILAFVTLMQGFTARASERSRRWGRQPRCSVLGYRTALAVTAFAAGVHRGVVGVRRLLRCAAASQFRPTSSSP